MKYQSDLIKEIVEKRGHHLSSLHYESECVESWIDETKGAYPKLCDYESEWLNYINENPIGVFPYETLVDITKATVDNVVPYAYKSAILKGNTLVNICKPFEFDIQTTESGLHHLKDNFNMLNIPIDDNKKYSMWVEIDINEIGPFSISHTGWSPTLVFEPITDLTLTGGSVVVYPCVKRKDSNNTSISIGAMSGSTEGRLKGRIMVFEGDVRGLELSYFEGMQSVQMPVLTTTGKNLFDENRRYESSNKLWFAIPFEKDSYFTFSSFDTIPYIEFYGTTTEFIDKLYGGDGVSWEVLAAFSNEESGTFKKGTKYNYVIIAFDKVNLSNGEDFLKNLQVEQGTQATPYEPFKSNILTVNEDVALRGIGEVQDELDCLTGEVVERIGEIILDDTLSYEHAWSGDYDTETDYIIGVKVNNHLWNVYDEENGSLIKCDKLNTRGITSFNSHGYFLFYVSKSVLGEDLTNAKIREYILSLNATVQYPLATESIKTVDLAVVNQDGDSLSKLIPIEGTMYLSTSSKTINPLFSGEIPVEAITQNLSSFIED